MPITRAPVQKLGWQPPRTRAVRHTIETMRAIARSRGGACLSPHYATAPTKLEWRCAEGHVWKAVGTTVKHRTWCPYCGHSVKLTIEEMQAIARTRGGWCVSAKYVDIATKLRWRCARGHEWEATPGSVKSGKWCRRCAGHEPLGIDEMRRIAARHGGRCLSTRYKSCKEALYWECAAGHRWHAPPDGMQYGKWCLRCAGKEPLTREELAEWASERGGALLSRKYVRALAPLRWRCARGHVFTTTAAKVRSGNWCRQCRSRSARREILQTYAASRGGACAAGPETKLFGPFTWYCARRHSWKMSLPDAYRRRWCPQCPGAPK